MRMVVRSMRHVVKMGYVGDEKTHVLVIRRIAMNKTIPVFDVSGMRTVMTQTEQR